MRAYRPDDRDAFCAWCAVPAAFDFLRKSAPGSGSPADLFGYFLAAAREATPGRHVWAIVDRESGALAGHLELKATAKTRPGEGELVYFVAPEHRRRGGASSAVARLAASPALAPEFTALVAFCRPSNAGSIAVLRRAGFDLSPDRSSSDALCFVRDVADRYRDA